jgi:ribosomal-protein-alanine N-acetyltransferase
LNETDQSRQAESDRVTTREIAYADLPAVISIERRSFTSPWSPGMFVLELSKDSTIGLAATVDGRVAGYIVLSRYDRAWHLMNVAVDPDRRRSGIATALIGGALERIGNDDAVTLEVRPSNRAAIALYEGLGFRPFGHRHGYYPDNGEDALVMWRGDPAAAGVPAEALGTG